MSMAFLSGKHLPRRTFVRGMGATIALPFLDAMVPAGRNSAAYAAAGPTRLIALEERVDPKLLGGLVVRTGDLVMDASLRSRLDALRHRLRAAVAAGSTGAP